MGRRVDTVKLSTKAIIGFFTHPTPHLKLVSEVAKYLVTTKPEGQQKNGDLDVNSPLFCLMGELLENNQGIFQIFSHFYLRNTKHPHQKMLISPTCLKTVVNPHIQEF